MKKQLLLGALAFLAMSCFVYSENLNVICTFTTCDSCTRHPECFWCSNQNRCHASDSTFRCNLRFSIFKPNQCLPRPATPATPATPSVPPTGHHPTIPNIPTPTPRLNPDADPLVIVPTPATPSTPTIPYVPSPEPSHPPPLPTVPSEPKPQPTPVPSPVPTPPTSIITCFSQAATDPNVCSGRGTCVAHDTCQCKTGYNGDRCNGVESARACDPGYSGETCSTPVCFSQEATDSNVCGGRGVCTAPNTCKCHTGFSGERCENGEGGIAAGSTSNSCSSGFTGANCDIPLCFSQPANDPNVCSGKGSCTAPDTCKCTSGYSGDRCHISPGF